MFDFELSPLLKQLLPHGGGIGKVLDGLLILAFEQLQIALKIIMLDHMIITKLNALPYII